MAKRGLALFFLFTYFLALLNPLSPFINYALNKQEIIEKFCENKDQPALHCEGKCHLEKEVQKKAATEENQDEFSKMEVVSPIGKVVAYTILQLKIYIEEDSTPSFTSKLLNNGPVKIDHPPEYL